MTECARCGDCCDPVVLSFDPQKRSRQRLDDAARGAVELDDDARQNYEFMLKHWHVIQPIVIDGYLTDSVEVACDQFNTTTRTCLAQDTKPPICAGFPWYGRADNDHEGRQPVADQLSPRCSFNADVPGRAFLPIVEVTCSISSSSLT